MNSQFIFFNKIRINFLNKIQVISTIIYAPLIGKGKGIEDQINETSKFYEKY